MLWCKKNLHIFDKGESLNIKEIDYEFYTKPVVRDKSSFSDYPKHHCSQTAKTTLVSEPVTSSQLEQFNSLHDAQNYGYIYNGSDSRG